MLAQDMIRHNAKIRPDRVAVTYAGGEITYRELLLRTNCAANALRGLGVKKGERVAVLAQNCHEYVELYFAAGKAGAVTTPLNYRLTGSEIEHIVNDSEATVVIAQDSFAPVIESIREKLPRVKELVCIGQKRDGWRDYEAWTAAASGDEPPEVATENDLIWQMYTSGTTGRPKGAMITHRNLLTNVLQFSMAFGDLKDEDRTLIVAPLYHAAAVVVSMCTIARGARLVVKQDFNPPEVVASFDKEGVTHALLVPAMILFLLNMPDIDKVNFGSLRCVFYGASAIPLEVLKKAMATFDCQFLQAFGQTESVALLTQLSADDHVKAAASDDPRVQRRLLSCGREVFGTEVRIVDEQGKEVARGEVGEIAARGDQVMKGYWKLPEATSTTLKDGWLHTGDLGTMDEDGYVYVVDRLKDMIVSGGENVFPREIEDVLFQHPAIADATVIGVPSDQWGEEAKAVVVLKPGQSATAEAILGYCKGKLAGFKRPRSVDFVAALPKNPSGKVLKRELREPYWAGRGRRVS